MRVLAISDHYRNGGAAIACERVLDALRSHVPGIEIARISQHGDLPSTPDHWRLAPDPRLQTWGRRLRAFGLEKCIQQRIENSIHSRLAQIIDAFSPDLIYLHNIHGADHWGLPLVEKALQHKPVLWMLHDMWSFTGGCAYSYQCNQYKTGCDADCTCPDEAPKPPANELAQAFQARRALLKNPKLFAQCPSHWLRDCAVEGLWSPKDVSVIPYPMPLGTYTPDLRESGRGKLGLKDGETTALIVSDYLDQPRKGGHYLREALSKLASPLTLLTMGNNPVMLDQPKLKCLHLGYLRDETEKARIFAAADLLIHPAPVDNRPLVISEANCCGTPVLGFPIGGVQEMIVEGESGWLASGLSADALLVSLERALADIQAGRFDRARCRAFAEKTYSPETIAAETIGLMQRIAHAI